MQKLTHTHKEKGHMSTISPEQFDVMKNKTLEQSKSEQNQMTISFKLRNGECLASVHPIGDALG